MKDTDQSNKSLPRASLTSEENLVVGMLGGTMETIALMPLITYKFCKQEGRPYPRFPGMYRGVAIQAGNVAPVTAVQMFFNGVFENALKSQKQPNTDLSTGEVIACGLGAGAMSAILYGPVDLTMIHQQKQNLNITGTIKHLSRTYGPLSIFRGLSPTIAREAIYSAGYLALAPICTKRIMQIEGLEDQYFLSSLLGAISAGIVSNISSHPIDTIKTVQQADMAKEKYTNSLQTFYRLVNQEGIKSLFKGGLARTLRGCGAYFIVSSFREFCIQRKTNNGSLWGFTS